MSSLKEIKNRIASVRSTRQITSAMKMLASAKLHKAQGRVENLLPYQRKLNEILLNFLHTHATFVSPYTENRRANRVAVVICSSNTSLCGAFNANVAKLAEQVASEYKSQGIEVEFYTLGKKIEEAVRKAGYSLHGDFQELVDTPTYQQACGLAEKLMRLYAERQIDKVELIYYHFKSVGTQQLLREEYLPIDLELMEKEGLENKVAYNNDYIIEPDIDELLASLLPKVLSLKIYAMLLDSTTSEHAARMLAMQTATDNANDLIQDLTKQYNKGRQQAITNELLDIVAGSLK